MSALLTAIAVDNATGVATVICINMIHISPWSATVGLMRNAAAILPTGGLLYLYGPYRRDGALTALSNEAFDADLKARNPARGVRDLEAVAAALRASNVCFWDAPRPWSATMIGEAGAVRFKAHRRRLGWRTCTFGHSCTSSSGTKAMRMPQPA
jgi:hypothetical protein